MQIREIEMTRMAKMQLIRFTCWMSVICRSRIARELSKMSLTWSSTISMLLSRKKTESSLKSLTPAALVSSRKNFSTTLSWKIRKPYVCAVATLSDWTCEMKAWKTGD